MLTTYLGVAGWPVAHSRSPAMHNAALAAAGLRGWRYLKLPLPPHLFAETVRALPAAGFAGANVTIPHKEAALAIATRATEVARAIGAANTLTFADGAIEADNTDAPGLIAALPGLPPGTALVLGAGGSARAAAWALKDQGATEVMAYCSHGVLSGAAEARVAASVLTELVVTDSIFREGLSEDGKIRRLTIAPLFGEAIHRIADESSVSSLFD